MFIETLLWWDHKIVIALRKKMLNKKMNQIYFRNINFYDKNKK